MTRRPFWRASIEDEVESELAFHLEMTTRALVEHGMSEQNARAEAARRFGNAAAVDAECRRYAQERDRNQRKAEYRHELTQDVAFALRQLVKAPAFAAIAVLTLALGIGATAAVFSVLNAVVLRPLPFDHADRVVVVYASTDGDTHSPSVPDFFAMRNVHEFEHVAAGILEVGIAMKTGDAPEMIQGGRVAHDYFAVYGVQPQIGRAFTAHDDELGAPNVAVISHRLWMSHFNGERSLVGRTVSLDGRQSTIIGVMPSSFDFTNGSEDIWVPLAFTPEQRVQYNEHYLPIVARLRAGVTLERAMASATAAERTMAERIPERTRPVNQYAIQMHRYVDDLVGDYRDLLMILLGAVSFVLLIACTNVANLLLARGSTRAKELAIRAALGAGRGRLVRQLLTESLVLAVTGSVLGLAIAFALVKLVVTVAPSDVPRIEQAGIDWRVFGFTLGVGVVSAIVFGLLPAFRSAGPQLQGALREGGRSSRGGRDRLRAVLVTAEVALAITLLVGSGLLLRSAWLIEHVDPGFDPRGVLTARLMLPESRYPDGPSIVRLFESVRDEAAHISGVRSSSLVLLPPLSGSALNSSIEAEGERQDKPPSANMRLASDGYLATMGIPLLAGRDIAKTDRASSPPVMVINQAMARKLWPALDPRETIGKRVDALSQSRAAPHYMTVIGIAGDLHDAGLDKPVRPEFYSPVEQTPEYLWPLLQRSLIVVLKTRNRDADPRTLVRPLREVIAHIDPSLPIADARSMESYRRESLATARMNTILLSTLGGIALVLAMVGIYGVVSYFVSQRTHEIGVRMALGATPGRVWQFVIRRGLAPIVSGLVIGFGLSLLATSVLRQQLYHVTTHDPVTLGGVGATLLAVALLAMYLPARRAMRVAPIVALNDS
ncbi:MAG TPA: ABC transporter permease [Gemmatimonadaceae bacterium]|nr:ABC transporter permease [Gemmatimonadaceae bacterium]